LIHQIAGSPTGPAENRGALAAVFFLVVLGSSLSAGFYSLPAFLILAVALAALLWVHLAPGRLSLPLRPLLGFGLVIMAAATAGLFFRMAHHQAGPLVAWTRGLLIAAAALSLLYLAPRAEGRSGWRWIVRFRFPLLFAIAGLARLLLLLDTHDPGASWPRWYASGLSDVYIQMNRAPDFLIRGQDPYAVDFLPRGPGLPGINSYTYLPGSLLMSAPFRWAFGDVRIGYLILGLLAALLLMRVAPPPGSRSVTPELLALCLLYHPRALYILDQAWNEQFLVPLLVVLAWLLQKRGGLSAQALALAGVFSLKLYLLLLAPLLWRFRRLSRPALLAGLALAGLVTLPFVLWNPAAFWEDAVGLHLRNVFAPQGLTLWSFLSSTFGLTAPGPVVLACALVVPAFLVWRGPRGGEDFWPAVAAFYFAFFFLNKYAFINYYYLVGACLLIALAARSGEKPEPAADD
jgi:hypothetical protein